MLICNNWSDVNAGVHQGLLNVNFINQMEEFSGMIEQFTNSGFQKAATAAHAQMKENMGKVDSCKLLADRGALVSKKRSGPPKRSANFKMIKVPAPAPKKP